MNPAVLSSQTSIFITFLASFLIWFMFAGLFYLWVINGKVKKEQAIHALLACLVAWALSQMIKTLFPSLRPFETNGKPPLTMIVPFDGGFPSGHSAVAFALASIIWFHDKKAGKIFVISAILVALGRIMGNVHYFLDVVAGGILGVATGLVLERSHLTKILKK